ncbi:hypothetical protein SAMN06269185_2660 [Natronoarchaeum philippinense]|uniref:Probable inorganic carbon transporter subunit DabA n=1 Tax=Natronoarchaeum philippinense TaxID=558529 RepID=A0A285P2K4_NATPI|nr:DUF2309 domain-containing protein [Natronoarchaeum philippinense]SNZ15962.1 hypothetical protein SAMN06269185_2660 [Natronoarchaeum philippinense]
MEDTDRSEFMDPNSVRARVDNAAESIGRVWPLYADVAANPLAGFEDLPFEDAVAQGEELYGGQGYPSAEYFRRAWERGEIDPTVLTERLDDAGIDADPETVLDRMDEETPDEGHNSSDDLLDRLLSKWLAAFLDQGETAWAMPNRERGFYEAWRELAPYDDEIPAATTPVGEFYRDRLTDLPDTAMEALYVALADVPEERWEATFEHHLAALPGWTGLIKQREGDDNNPWQDAYPITLIDYLAARLILAKHLGEPIAPQGERRSDAVEDRPPAAVWLDAWEESYRQELVDAVRASEDAEAQHPDNVEAEANTAGDADAGTGATSDGPAAQFVFCIDTRSEIIRRHLEATGPYETHGYAGFFGVPIRHEGYGEHVSTDSCPVIAEPKHRIDERATADGEAERHDRWHDLSHAGHKLMKSLKNDVAGAFGFVEGAGGFFGAALAARTLLPSSMYDLRDGAGSPDEPEFCEPAVDPPDADDADAEVGPAGGDAPDETVRGDAGEHLQVEADGLPRGISTEQQAFYAEAAFDLMGWDEFAPLVVFAGHASQTVNNPYKSSIDCGACAGSSGVPNARTLASICNEPAVRSQLAERGIEIPDETVFVAAEHDTTTDEITLFADDDLRAERAETFERLERDLETARGGAAAERIETIDGAEPSDPVRETERRAADWAEPRPEIGLSGNAGFVVGRRELTSGVDLDGRAFLHTYDWATDPDGEALENILVGPLVVVQMISAQYYFSTVDNDVYGSGTKVTHNPVGKIGVYQGNGGDLRMGLPFQSLHDDDGAAYHSPLRPTTLLQAPVERVEAILERNDGLRELFDNEWLKLSVLDPERGDAVFHYRGELEWESEQTESSTPTQPVSAD